MGVGWVFAMIFFQKRIFLFYTTRYSFTRILLNINFTLCNRFSLSLFETKQGGTLKIFFKTGERIRENTATTAARKIS